MAKPDRRPAECRFSPGNRLLTGVSCHERRTGIERVNAVRKDVAMTMEKDVRDGLPENASVLAGNDDIAGEEISEAMRQAVESVVEPITKVTGRLYGNPPKKVPKRLTAKMRAFATRIAKGEDPKQAYLTVYNVKNRSKACLAASVNNLMKDPRIAAVAEEAWEAVKDQIVHDQTRTRQHVMNELLKHSLEAKNDATKIKALELMGRAIGLFTDKVEQRTETVSTADLKKELEQTIALMDEKPVNRSLQ